MTLFEKRQMFNNAYTKVVYEIMRISSKTFISVGLQLNATNLYFDDNESFSLVGFTCAYYNPIDNSIHINIEDKFFDVKNMNELHAKLFFILFHEVMHHILTHSERSGNKNHMIWNMAADYEVHNMYYIFAHVNEYSNTDKFIIGEYFNVIDSFLLNGKTFLFDKKYLEYVAEEIYEIIHDSSEIHENESIMVSLDSLMGEGKAKDSTNCNVKVTKTKLKFSDGTENESIDIEWPENVPNEYKQTEDEKEIQKTSDMTNKSLLENTFNQILKDVKQKGDIEHACGKFIKKLFHIKVDWEKILRNSLQTMLDKSDYFAWNKVRTSTFLLPGMPYLPDVVEDTEKYGTLVISRDESGSMTDDDIAKAVQIIVEAKAHYKKIVLLKHDTEISSEETFEELSADTLKQISVRASCGGTSHKDVFEYLKEYRKKNRDERISCYIGITDMESDIEQYQNIIPADIPIIYLTPYKFDKNYEQINGKIIPIE